MKKKILFQIIVTIPLLLLFFQSVNKPAHATGSEKSSETHDQTTKSKLNNVTILQEQLKQYASLTVYTVQTGSFIHRADAQKQFNFIVQGLPEKDLDYLRIEKIGKYYSVRIGMFEDRVNADTFLQAMKSWIPTALKLKAYIKDDRIIKIYRGSSSVDKQKIDEKVLVDSKPQKTGLQENEKSLHQIEPVIYTIQTGSFIHTSDAQEQFNFIVQGLPEKDLDYLRIEKIGKYYSVRIGMFEDRVNADTFLQAMKSWIPTALKLKAYIKDDRIIKIYRDPSSVDKQKIEEKVLADSKSVDKQKIEEKVLADPKPQKTVLQENEESVHQIESEIHTIPTGSFMYNADAQRKHDFMMQESNTRNLDYIFSYLSQYGFNVALIVNSNPVPVNSVNKTTIPAITDINAFLSTGDGVLDILRKDLEAFYITARHLRMSNTTEDLEIFAEVTREYLSKRIDPLFKDKIDNYSPDVQKTLTELQFLKAHLLYEIDDVDVACETVSDLGSSDYHESNEDLKILDERFNKNSNSWLVMADFSYMCK